MAEDVLLHLNNIDVFYGSIQVLAGISLEVKSGEIVAIVGLKETSTGDTLCDPEHPITLEKISFPEEPATGTNE